MKIEYFSYKKIIFLLIILLLASSSGSNNKYEEELLDLSYLVMKASAINIIYGLYLEEYQIRKLRELSIEFEKTDLPSPRMKAESDFKLYEIKSTFIEAIDYLYNKKVIPEKLKNEVNQMRIIEAEYIKKGIVGAQNNYSKKSYKQNSCLSCHAPPEYFPDGNISKIETNKITSETRTAIDQAHVYGILGKEGTLKIWELKDEVDNLLTSGQKYLLKNFRCCIIPPDNLKNSTNIGQAFVSDEWLSYLSEVNKATDKIWKEYRQLYIIPLEDYIKASLPGITKIEKKRLLNKAVTVLEESRKLDEIDFELQKENLCLKLKDALSIDELTGENNREKEVRQFISAMYLLFPGNSKIYDKLLREVK